MKKRRGCDAGNPVYCKFGVEEAKDGVLEEVTHHCHHVSRTPMWCHYEHAGETCCLSVFRQVA